MNINAAFRFHNIGQGLFYSGLISKKDSNNHSTFSFVYDCGTKSSRILLRQEIDSFKQLLPTARYSKNKKLDLLVISHLHDDHVNGLEYLLKNVEVDTVVMPYVHDGLKLLARLESANDSEFLQEFYLDPVGWFITKKVRRVLLLGSDGFVAEKNSINLMYIEDSDIYVNSESILHIEDSDETEIAYLKNISNIKYQNFYWEFDFENLKLEKADSYIKIVEEFQRKRCLTLEQIFKSKSFSNELRKELRKLFSPGNELNRTSVVLLHRPIMENVVVFLDMSKAYGSLPIMESDDCYLCGTVLTGDVILGDNEELSILKDSYNYLVFQFPHHGSKDNNIKYFTGLGAFTKVLSYGLTNKHGHPHGEVLQDIERISFVNERQALDYQLLINK